MSSDEKKLFDVVARAYLAALMPDFRYRQTTATLDVRGFEFHASGRQPIDLGWRAAFPDWQPADEKGDEAQLLPLLRNGETGQLHDPKIEDKETRPPPRYNEGTLIEAMQNAWRFVDDEVLRDRLKEAKGIGTPATRAEIIGGLKKQSFLTAQGKHIVPTETGLSLFGILKQADPALVDPGVTAQLECLLDDVVGKQEMVGAIDAVCDVAERIIGKLKDGAAAGGPPLPGAAEGNSAAAYPPTPAMKRFAESLVRQKGYRASAGYKTSIQIVASFSTTTRPRKPTVKRLGSLNSNRSVRPSCCTPRRSRRGKASSFPTRPRPAQLPCLRGSTRTEARTAASRSQDRLQAVWFSCASIGAADKQVSERQSWRQCRSPSPPAQPNSVAGTPLRIPYGNKDVAIGLPPAMARQDGIRRPELIWLHSASADGCNVRRHAVRALTDSSATTRLRSGWRVRLAKNSRSPTGRWLEVLWRAYQPCAAETETSYRLDYIEHQLNNNKNYFHF